MPLLWAAAIVYRYLEGADGLTPPGVTAIAVGAGLSALGVLAEKRRYRAASAIGALGCVVLFLVVTA